MGHRVRCRLGEDGEPGSRFDPPEGCSGFKRQASANRGPWEVEMYVLMNFRNCLETAIQDSKARKGIFFLNLNSNLLLL